MGLGWVDDRRACEKVDDCGGLTRVKMERGEQMVCLDSEGDELDHIGCGDEVGIERI